MLGFSRLFAAFVAAILMALTFAPARAAGFRLVPRWRLNRPAGLKPRRFNTGVTATTVGPITGIASITAGPSIGIACIMRGRSTGIGSTARPITERRSITAARSMSAVAVSTACAGFARPMAPFAAWSASAAGKRGHHPNRGRRAAPLFRLSAIGVKRPSLSCRASGGRMVSGARDPLIAPTRTRMAG